MTSNSLIIYEGSMNSAHTTVTVIGPEKLAALVVDAGLANWLIRKVS